MANQSFTYDVSQTPYRQRVYKKRSYSLRLVSQQNRDNRYLCEQPKLVQPYSDQRCDSQLLRGMDGCHLCAAFQHFSLNRRIQHGSLEIERHSVDWGKNTSGQLGDGTIIDR